MSTPADLLDTDELMSYGGPVDGPTALGIPPGELDSDVDTDLAIWAAGVHGPTRTLLGMAMSWEPPRPPAGGGDPPVAPPADRAPVLVTG